MLLVKALLFVLTCSNAQNKDLKLWYDEPANVWTDALPIGNGRLGAMVYGKITDEIIQFNEETLWAGQPHDYITKGANNYFETIREYSENGNGKVYDIAKDHFMSNPIGQQCYQPTGNILLSFPDHNNISNYYRGLNLENAITKVSYNSNGVNFSREILASNPDQAIVIHLTADVARSLNFSVELFSPHVFSEVIAEKTNLILRGKATDYKVHENVLKEHSDNVDFPKSRIRFESVLKVLSCDGELTTHGTKLEIKNATETTLILVAATNFVNFKDISGDPTKRNNALLKQINDKTYEFIKATHIQDYKKLFDRLTLDLGDSKISERPTDERIQTFNKDIDPALVTLLFQYGRYLLIASSREGTQPSNLQGIWNNEMFPPWDSKYTININTEMNYWLAEKTNLSECTEPLIKMVKELSVSGKKIAKAYYNMNGWVTHHNTDIWRAAAPIDGVGWGIWPTGGAWLTQHLWWHYEFTGNQHYLEDVYPILKEASRFFLEYLTPSASQSEWLISGPSNSPEHGGLVMGPTMDHQIIRNLFKNTIEAAETLNKDKGFIDTLRLVIKRIAPNQIGKYGQLQEWLEDNDDPDDTHRHVSHLWGLHPGNEIHPLTTPDFAEACKISLKHRGDEGTGWSRAWKINFWARLNDGNHAFSILKKLITPVNFERKKSSYETGGLYKNMFDAHPPFQIDGNFGVTSGIVEMILQSHLRDVRGNYFLDVLPALPNNLKDGKIKGLRAEGGFEIDVEWKNGFVQFLKVKSLLGNKCNIRAKQKLVLKSSTTKRIHEEYINSLFCYSFETSKDENYVFINK
ncbi:glycoside hydrolase family 95 protein [Snuella lapsa]